MKKRIAIALLFVSIAIAGTVHARGVAPVTTSSGIFPSIESAVQTTNQAAQSAACAADNKNVYCFLAPVTGITGINLAQQGDVGNYLRTLFVTTVAFGGVAMFFALVYAGLQYITAGVNVGKKAGATDYFWKIFQGFAVVVVSFTILTTINPDLTKFAFDVPPIEGKKPTIGVLEDLKNLGRAITGQPKEEVITAEDGIQVFTNTANGDSSVGDTPPEPLTEAQLKRLRKIDYTNDQQTTFDARVDSSAPYTGTEDAARAQIGAVKVGSADITGTGIGVKPEVQFNGTGSGTLAGLVQLRKDCVGCELVVNSVQDGDHKTHNEGTNIADIRSSDTLKQFLNTHQDSKPKNIILSDGTTPAREYYYNGNIYMLENENASNEHFHVRFRNQ